jgi:hypothetical protein
MIEIKFVDGTRSWIPKMVMGIKTKKLTESHNIAKAMQWIFEPVCRCLYCFSNAGFDGIVNMAHMNLEKNIIGTLMRAWCRTCGKDQFTPVQMMNLHDLVNEETK